MASAKNSEIVHLIDDDGEICSSESLVQYVSSSLGESSTDKAALDATISKVGCDYRVVAVFGGQSTGKSTLLNKVFNTNFAMMNADDGRSQTTKGAFLMKSPHGDNLFVVDFEGTDGIERGEDQNFEKQLSLFALSIADVLLINMWATEVGRFNAANLSLLRTVFEVNLQLFTRNEERKPTLLFVCRDHTSGPEEKLFEKIVESLNKIWGSVTKPDNYTDAKMSDLFHLRFVAFPHYDLQKQEFLGKVDEVRPWFSNNSNDKFLFKEEGSVRGIPLNGLAPYLDSCWTAIRSHKDLDIPTQRDMLARLRCTELSERLAAKFDSELAAHKQKVRKGDITAGLSSVIDKLIASFLGDFEADTKLYSKTVVREERSVLEKTLRDASGPLFDMHCQKIADTVVRESDGSLQKSIDNALLVTAPKLAREWYDRLSEARKALKDDDSSEAIAKAHRRVDLTGLVKKFWRFLSDEVKWLTNHFQEEITTALENSCRTPENPVDSNESPSGMARTVSTVVNKQNQTPEIRRLLRILAGDERCCRDTMHRLEAAIKHKIEHRLSATTADMSTTMTRAFDKALNHDAQGAVRFLTTVTGLNDAYGPARATGLFLLAVLSVNRLSLIDDEPTTTWMARAEDTDLVDAELAAVLDEYFLSFEASSDPRDILGRPSFPAEKPSVEEPEEPQNPTLNPSDPQRKQEARRTAIHLLEALILVDNDAANRAYDLYQQHCDFSYKMAVRTIEGTKQNIPVWVYAALLLLGANEAYWLLTNPLLLIFICVMMWVFAKAWVITQWQKFEEAGPPAVVMPIKAGLAIISNVYATRVAPLIGGGATKQQQKQETKKKQ